MWIERRGAHPTGRPLWSQVIDYEHSLRHLSLWFVATENRKVERTPRNRVIPDQRTRRRTPDRHGAPQRLALPGEGGFCRRLTGEGFRSDLRCSVAQRQHSKRGRRTSSVLEV